MKSFTLTSISLLCIFMISYGQNSPPLEKEDFERPFNSFAAAGAGYRFIDFFDVSISPVDYSVQFEKVPRIHTKFSMGLVWNPIINKSEKYRKNYTKILESQPEAEANRRGLAIALLVNIAQLNYSSVDVNTTSPIDVGFGLGHRGDNFLILGTLEFTPLRTPRTFFVNDFNVDKKKPLKFSDTMEPIRTISKEDDNLFISKVHFFIGLKIAYTFTKIKKK